MTYDRAKEELTDLFGGDIDGLCHWFCNHCGVEDDWYCPTECELLQKARKIDLDRIIKCYARNKGDMQKVWAYLKNTKICRIKGGY